MKQHIHKQPMGQGKKKIKEKGNWEILWDTWKQKYNTLTLIEYRENSARGEISSCKHYNKKQEKSQINNLTLY